MGIILLGLSLSQWVVLLPQIWTAIKTAQEIYQALTSAQGVAHEEAVQQSLGILGKAVAKLAYDALGMAVPMPHKMTPEEEKLWMDRASVAF